MIHIYLSGADYSIQGHARGYYLLGDSTIRPLRTWFDASNQIPAGITIKLNTARMSVNEDGHDYVLNLIATWSQQPITVPEWFSLKDQLGGYQLREYQFSSPKGKLIGYWLNTNVNQENH